MKPTTTHTVLHITAHQSINQSHYVDQLPIHHDLPHDVHALLNLLHTHLFDETLVISECLCTCRDHSYSLQHHFAYFLGKTPHDYVQHHRLTFAETSLHETRQSPTDIALSVGYKTQCAFTMAFKHQFGLPPGEYRKQCTASDIGIIPQNQ